MLRGISLPGRGVAADESRAGPAKPQLTAPTPPDPVQPKTSTERSIVAEHLKIPGGLW